MIMPLKGSKKEYFLLLKKYKKYFDFTCIKYNIKNILKKIKKVLDKAVLMC